MNDIYKLIQYPGLIDEAFGFAVDENGEIQSEIALAHAERLIAEKQVTALDVAAYYRSIELEIEKADAEIARIKYIKDRHLNRQEVCRLALVKVLKPGEKMKDTRAEISWHKSSNIRIEIPVEDLPFEFVRIKTVTEPEKNALKKAMKEDPNFKINGVYLDFKTNLVIK